MARMNAVYVALSTAVAAIVGVPAITFAQAAAPERAGGGGWVLLVVFGLLAVAIVWFTMSQRRRSK